jgi:hypothetical protein
MHQLRDGFDRSIFLEEDRGRKIEEARKRYAEEITKLTEYLAAMEKFEAERAAAERAAAERAEAALVQQKAAEEEVAARAAAAEVAAAVRAAEVEAARAKKAAEEAATVRKAAAERAVAAEKAAAAEQPVMAALTARNLRSLGLLADARSSGDADAASEINSLVSTFGAASLASSRATSALTLESTQHSRERCDERGYTKRDLQKALKYADPKKDYRQTKGPNGELRFKIFYDGYVFITNDTLKVAITVYPDKKESTGRRVTANKQEASKVQNPFSVLASPDAWSDA